ncbi:MAG: TauD/TfdA family dioxygenase, partial [Planctomycetota bacterium]
MWIIPKKPERSRQVWDASSLNNSKSWRLQVPDDVGDEFQQVCRRHQELTHDLEGLVFDPGLLPHLCDFATTVRDTLVDGEGITWIKGLRGRGLSEPEQRLFYVALGLALGDAVTQYGRLYEIRDRSRGRAIPATFHTDSSARSTLPDFVGLLCEEPSLTGGELLVSNALCAHQIMQQEDPKALDLLYKSFVRDVVAPGVDRTRENLLLNRFPVFAPCAARKERLVFRYMRYWIEKGHEKAGEPLSDRHIAALDLLDDILSSKEQVLSCQLEKRDIV